MVFILDKYVPVSKTGQFAEKVLQYYEIDPPINKNTGKPTFAKKALQSLSEEYPNHPALEWLCYEPIKVCPLEKETYYYYTADFEPVKRERWKQSKPVRLHEVDPEEPQLPKKIIYEIKKQIYVGKHPALPRVFNLSSNAHLSWLLFKKYKCIGQK